MRRSVWIFLASIFLPSLGLAWLAVRSAQDQQILLEHQQVLLTQSTTDALAQNVQARMQQIRDDFAGITEQLLTAGPTPSAVAEDFDRTLRPAWPLAQIGFAVNLDLGEIYSPKSYDSPEAQTFRSENDRFLTNRENAEVYASKADALVQNFKLPAKSPPLEKDEWNLYAAPQRNSPAPLNAVGREVVPNTQAAATGRASESLHSVGGVPSNSARLAPQQIRSFVPAVSAGTSVSATASAPATTPALPTTPRLAPVVTAPGVADQLQLESARSTQTKGAASPATTRADLSSTSDSAAALSSGAAPTSTATAAGIASENQLDATSPAQGRPDLAEGVPETSSPAAASFDRDKGAAATSPLPATIPAPSLAPPVTAGSGLAGNLAQSPVEPAATGLNQKIARQVQPQQFSAGTQQVLSNTVPEESDFRRAIGAQPNGILARFVEDKLRLMVWSHPADSAIVFGAQLDPARLIAALKDVLTAGVQAQGATDAKGETLPPQYCVAILDDAGRPVARSVPDFNGDWKHPFVATEIGEVLPHWEAALYLIDPHQIDRTARTLRATLALIVLVLVAAIVAGGSLVAADVRRQTRLAQQKTDFVSNVSHELKTPLTSIRMFADLLAEQRVPDTERQSTYLRIISAEAARLTRLINNVLDFARLERGAPPGEHRDADLVEAMRDVVETCGPHLEGAGIAFHTEIEAETLPIRGDRDALAQIILNLVSNAEKYGGAEILVRVRRQETPAGTLGCVDVLDRGPGVPAGQARTIFEPFHRLDDSLASGIPGSGLGLTLARRMARSHGGDVAYAPRAGGGSCFTLSVPLRAP